MQSNHHTLEHHHHTASIKTQRRRQQRQLKKNSIQSTHIPSLSIHLSTPSSQPEDPFANMSAYVDYQQKIESLKTSLAPHAPKSTNKNDDSVRMTSPFNSTKERHHSRRPSFMTDMTGDDDGRYWSHGSVMSSGSSSRSSGTSSSGYLTPPRASSPPMTTTYHDNHHHQPSPPPCFDDDCYVTMDDKLKFLAFLRHRTGWQHTATNTVTDLDYMKSGGSLFFWCNGQ